jgi:hypothetical protein
MSIFNYRKRDVYSRFRDSLGVNQLELLFRKHREVHRR